MSPLEFRKQIESVRVNVLDMFAYQGPPSRRWLDTEGKYWEGWNKAVDKILSIVEEAKTE